MIVYLGIAFLIRFAYSLVFGALVAGFGYGWWVFDGFLFVLLGCDLLSSLVCCGLECCVYCVLVLS